MEQPISYRRSSPPEGYRAGTYFPQDPNPYQLAIVKFDAAGNQSWVKSYSVGDRAYRVTVDAQGNILATGVDSIGYMDWMTIKTDPNGNLLWSQRYDGLASIVTPSLMPARRSVVKYS